MLNSGNRPTLSVIVIAYNMAREIPRTLFTLSTAYQRGITENDYEVIVVDNGSTDPIRPSLVESFGPNFRLIRLEWSPSPSPAINIAAEQARGEALSICIDGARMVTPGVLMLSLQALGLANEALISTVNLHLGPKVQNDSMLEGYNQEREDALLDTVDWRNDGYELFRISSPALSMKRGWFGPLSESNFFTIRRSIFTSLGGFDEGFRSPGGGLVNLDFYRLACEKLQRVVVLLGEGSFHQFHGGVATNSPRAAHPGAAFREEYEKLRGCSYAVPNAEHVYLGTVPPQAIPLLTKGLANAPTSSP